MRNLLLGLLIIASTATVYFSSEILKVKNITVEPPKTTNSITVTPTPGKQYTSLLLVGDVMIGRSVNMRSLAMGNVNYPFEKVAGKLRDADIVFANLENPIIDNCPIIEHGFTFCADPKMADGLNFAGIDVVSIANNHTYNFGKDGFTQTKRILDSKGILWVGDSNLAIIEKNGTKFGFLGFDLVSNTGLSGNEMELIRQSDKKVDVLVTGVHWGAEYKAVGGSYQREWARKLVEAGVDVVSGHHPHWVQDDEKVLGKPVYYSLGNFVFDQMWSEETRKGLAVDLTFEGKEIINELKYPTYIKEWAQPEWVNSN